MPAAPKDPQPHPSFGPLADRFLQSLERPLATLVREILASPGQSVQELSAALDEHMREIAETAEHDEFVDLLTARQVHEGCRELLTQGYEQRTANQKRLIQAAVLYFILERDADADMTSVIGFDDDAVVLKKVKRELSRGGE